MIPTVYITAIKDVLVGLSAIFVIVFGYMGLTTWRKELKGKSEYQLAKEVLKSAYRVREAFKIVRNPAIFQNEYPEEMLDARGYLKPENEHAGTVHVYQKRWEIMAEAFSRLEEHHLDAQVEWGATHQDKILKLRDCKADLITAIQQMLERKRNPRDAGLTGSEMRTEERSVLYYHGDNSISDKFTPEINAAVDEFEHWLRPYIKR